MGGIFDKLKPVTLKEQEIYNEEKKMLQIIRGEKISITLGHNHHLVNFLSIFF